MWLEQFQSLRPLPAASPIALAGEELKVSGGTETSAQEWDC